MSASSTWQLHNAQLSPPAALCSVVCDGDRSLVEAVLPLVPSVRPGTSVDDIDHAFDAVADRFIVNDVRLLLADGLDLFAGVAELLNLRVVSAELRPVDRSRALAFAIRQAQYALAVTIATPQRPADALRLLVDVDALWAEVVGPGRQDWDRFLVDIAARRTLLNQGNAGATRGHHPGGSSMSPVHRV